MHSKMLHISTHTQTHRHACSHTDGPAHEFTHQKLKEGGRTSDNHMEDLTREDRGKMMDGTLF